MPEGDDDSGAVKVLREVPTAMHDVPGALRKLADRIEAGELGEITAVGVVTLSNGLDVFGYGRDAEAGKLTLMFSRAIHRFVMGVI